jgi:hypothetical protein
VRAWRHHTVPPYHSRETLPEPKSKRVNAAPSAASGQVRRFLREPQPEMPIIGKAARVPVPLRRKIDSRQSSA